MLLVIGKSEDCVGSDFITNANPGFSCVYICKFQFRPIHPPPLGDYQDWRVAGGRRSPPSQTRGRRPTHPPLGRWGRRFARQPTKRGLPLGLGCPASSSDGGGEDEASSPHEELLGEGLELP